MRYPTPDSQVRRKRIALPWISSVCCRLVSYRRIRVWVISVRMCWDRMAPTGNAPYSTPLIGMSGGVGSLVGLGMLRGVLGSVSGAATGFRLPMNCAPGIGTAFGAGTGNLSAAPASRALPRKGVGAPTAPMRRRGKEEDKDKPAKVFVPGEQLEVPVLE
ncbi:hypothetical protein ABZ894_22005 [Nocardia beijingensis]|uniref:hypothetical protein n=1 Tax=Nocardia beijingensis TaxID=95162 RepID=UPI0033F1A789